MNLHDFEGKTVIGAKIAVANAGVGLSAALKIEPQELKHGAKVFVVLECVVDKITYEPVKDSDSLVRVQRLKAGTAAIVDSSLVANVLDAQRQKIEAAAGITRLNFEDGDIAEL